MSSEGSQGSWAGDTSVKATRDHLFPYPRSDYSEPRRGQFHFSSQAGWLNDPNGLLYYRGTYHLFYQHNPYSLSWGTMYWGHAVSPDLVHWRQRPIALHPDLHPGVLFSGGGVVDTDNTTGLATAEHDPMVVFTGTDEIRAMVSLDGGDTFQPFDGGRVLVRPGGRECRDPKVFWHPDSQQWIMVLWSDKGGNGLDFFGSTELRYWTFLSRFAADWAFECPDVAAMPVASEDGRSSYVLTTASGAHIVGDFDGTKFRSDQRSPHHIVTGAAVGARSYYWAAQTFSNVPGGRVVSLGWQGRNQGSVWTGNMTFPVEQRLALVDGELRVVSEPVHEIERLHHRRRTVSHTLAAPDAVWLGADPAGPGTEGIDLQLDVDVSTDHAGFVVEAADDDGVQEILRYDARHHAIDGHPLPDTHRLRIRLLIDRDQTAVFVPDVAYYSVANRELPIADRPAAIHLRALDDGEHVTLSMTTNSVRSAWVQT